MGCFGLLVAECLGPINAMALVFSNSELSMITAFNLQSFSLNLHVEVDCVVGFPDYS